MAFVLIAVPSAIIQSLAWIGGIVIAYVAIRGGFAFLDLGHADESDFTESALIR